MLQPNDKKLAELILYVARQSEDDPRFGATKLNKILFYADFLHYGRHGRSITEQDYQALPQGPAPRRLLPVQEALREQDALAIQHRPYLGRTQKRVIALREPDLSEFSGSEIAVVNDVIRALRRASARGVSELSHKFPGWKAAHPGETIPYETVFVSVPDLTEEEIGLGLRLWEQIRGEAAA